MNLAEQFRRDGYAIITEFISTDEASELRSLLSVDPTRGGQRNVLNMPQVREAAERWLGAASAVLGSGVQPIRGIFFDKQPGANWKVPYHQDRTIAVEERIETEGYSAWSVKDGVDHVRPPLKVLDRCLALRVHLDPCGADNGALRVLPGSHLHGHGGDEAVLEVVEGDAILMSPLLFHASSPAVVPRHRRVLHIEYSNAVLANGLRFHRW